LVKLFEHEKVSSTTPWFEFSATDPEGDDSHFQIQIDDDYGFGSVVEDKNTSDNFAQFTNIDNTSDKSPYTNGQAVRFIPSSSFTSGTTYWWRVRAKDPNGSNSWGAWSASRAFTIGSVSRSTWFQTTEEQFETGTMTGVEAVSSDQVQLISGSSTGYLISPTIDFDWKTDGTVWGSLSWSDTETTGDIKYHVLYYTSTSSWNFVPDSDLSGNAAGFDASPVDIKTLDTTTYNLIRIRADLTDAGGSPSLQEMTVSWDYRVETPTIIKLFPNEKTGTTTPTFEFYTTDPQDDDLTYQISWSTDNTFTSSTTKTSGVDAGFVNYTSGGSDPYDSGDVIRFTIQTADSLTDGSTYWWRVRAKDPPPGDNGWSLWTDARSFTVDVNVTVSNACSHF